MDIPFPPIGMIAAWIVVLVWVGVLVVFIDAVIEDAKAGRR